MFGGLVFTVQGNTVVGVVGDELLVRVAPDDTEQALAQPGARPFEVRGRISKGWVTVAGEVLDDHVLNDWLQLGRKATAALPPK
ncbi:TfoX/Sxy family protein [Streptomyces lavendulae]|nr:TfoX/Sxy family protein [Streptomyces lavendulae]